LRAIKGATKICRSLLASDDFVGEALIKAFSVPVQRSEYQFQKQKSPLNSGLLNWVVSISDDVWFAGDAVVALQP